MDLIMDRFDLEQKILDCWHVVDDISDLLEAYESLTEDQRLNILIGLKDLYKVKFEKTFSIFETIVRNKGI